MRVNVRLLLCIAALLIAASASAAQDLGERHYEPTGSFSFCPPAGWTEREAPGHAYKVFYTKLANGLTPNLTVREMPYPGPLGDFVSGNLKGLEDSGVKGYKLPGKSDIVTYSKRRGVKAAAQLEMNGRLLRQTFYSFDKGDGKKLLLTYTAPADSAQAFDKLFDESIRTLRMEASSIH
jgi:hypothetical protein